LKLSLHAFHVLCSIYLLDFAHGVCSTAVMYDLKSAIRKFRDRAGFTQQELANRLSITARTVAGYEADREPSPPVLRKLATIASDLGFDDFVKQFSSAYARAMLERTTPANTEEEVVVRAILILMRDKELVPNWGDIFKGMLTGLERLVVDAASGRTKSSDVAPIEQAFILLRGLASPSAERKLARLATERSAQTGETYHEAYTAVLLENPNLYEQYLQERAAAAKGTSFEASMAVGKPKTKGVRKK
jgi:transcriptional regulator with XRE-family HTH domain